MKPFFNIAFLLLSGALLVSDTPLARAQEEEKKDPAKEAAFATGTGEYDRENSIKQIDALHKQYNMEGLTADRSFMYKPGSDAFPATLNGQKVQDYVAITQKDSKTGEDKLVTFQPVGEDGNLIPMSMLVKDEMLAAWGASRNAGNNEANKLGTELAKKIGGGEKGVSAQGGSEDGGGNVPGECDAGFIGPVQPGKCDDKNETPQQPPAEERTSEQIAEDLARSNAPDKNSRRDSGWSPGGYSPSGRGGFGITSAGRSPGAGSSGGGPVASASGYGGSGSEDPGDGGQAYTPESDSEEGQRFYKQWGSALKDQHDAWRKGNSFTASGADSGEGKRVVDAQRNLSDRLLDGGKSAIGSLAKWAGWAPTGPDDGMVNGAGAMPDGGSAEFRPELEVDTGKIWQDEDGRIHSQKDQVVVVRERAPHAGDRRR